MKKLLFYEVVDAADALSLDEQLELVSILKRRIRDAMRQRLIENVQISQQEYAQGLCQPATVDEIMRKILED